MVGNGISRRLGRTSHGGGGNIGAWISSRMSHGWELGEQQGWEAEW